MKSRAVTAVAVVSVYVATATIAQNNAGVFDASFSYNGQTMEIAQARQISGAQVAALYRVPSDCAGICLAPHHASENVVTVSELDVLDFITTKVANGNGVLIDSRLPADRAVAFLPASVNVPHSLITPDNPLLTEILVALGARSFDGSLNFTDAVPIMVFDDGPTTGDASTFIIAILDAGYPADKIKYYRGGMQVWTAMGLTTQGTQS